MELELGDTLAVLRRLSPKVMQVLQPLAIITPATGCQGIVNSCNVDNVALPQASLGLRSSLWSYNPMLTAWEPVIEPWDVIVKLDSNRSNEVGGWHAKAMLGPPFCSGG
jgi:hypothetical protein